jgi:hypothetical protein
MKASLVNGKFSSALRYRWVYVRANLQVEKNLKEVQALARRAKAVGYNGIVLADYKLQILDSVPPNYFRNIAALKHSISELGLEIFPAVCPVGYSNGLLSHDPNLAEGVPVRDAPFIVRNRVARLMADEPIPLTGDQRLRVKTFRQYHVSISIKRSQTIRASILTTSGRELVRTELRGGRKSWATAHVVFNSLENERVRFLVNGAEHRQWKNASVKEVSLLNVLRRTGTPLAVRSENRIVYEEGCDFRRFEDNRLGVVPYSGEYEVYHPSGAIRLNSRSRIKEGQRLRVSYYHCIAPRDGQMICCLTDPNVYALLEDQIRRVRRLFEPSGFFLGHDEIRVANWCDACQARELTPGRLLADNVHRCIEMIRRVNRKAELFIWSDMFDPTHNARDRYYLVNGSLARSWEGLPKKVTVVNWNFDHRTASLEWFAKRGHAQVIAGFYDRAPETIRPWIEKSRKVPNLAGAMYTTWTDNYKYLEAFARCAWGQSRLC